tara:strand:- start:486 stop:722 length:237 start_codon:yes stop_codon:yes gene_type:complete
MKIFEVMQGTLQVLDDNDKEVTLQDPKTKVKTVVPKDPNKPGMIQRDPSGKLIMSNKPGQPQEVDKEIKVGDTVEVGQ